MNAKKYEQARAELLQFQFSFNCLIIHFEVEELFLTLYKNMKTHLNIWLSCVEAEVWLGL